MTAEEIWLTLKTERLESVINEGRDYQITPVIDFITFQKALAEYKSGIISLIDDEIVEQELYKWNHTVKVLSELKQKIQNDKRN